MIDRRPGIPELCNRKKCDDGTSQQDFQQHPQARGILGQDDGFKIDGSSDYYDTSYKVAADFEFLLRAIFVGRIKTRYICKDFVTMRSGGASNRGARSHRQIDHDHLRALKQNGVYSNIFFLGLRYIYKIGEIVSSRCGLHIF